MRGALVGAIRMLGIAMKVAAHIPARNSQVSHDRNHGVGKILTNALSRPDRFFDCRIDPCAALHVRKILVELGVQSRQQLQGFPPATFHNFQLLSPALRLPARYRRNGSASACPSNPPDRSWHRVRPMRRGLATRGSGEGVSTSTRASAVIVSCRCCPGTSKW